MGKQKRLPPTQETEPDLCLSVSCRDTGQQWSVMGTGARLQQSGRCSLWHKSSWKSHHQLHYRGTEQTTHKLEDTYTKKALALLQNFQGSQQISQPGDPAKSLRTPRELDIEGQWNLTTELPQDWGNRHWRAQTKPCAHQDPGERSSDPKRD